MASAKRNDWLAKGFEAHRLRLRALAHRMLGSPNEADDAVQDVWLDLSRIDANTIENLGGWLTLVVARVCIDRLRSRSSRREEPFGVGLTDTLGGGAAGIDPGDEVVRAESLGLALLVVLERLTPAERVAFMLRDVFGLPFEEIAPVVGRTQLAARQLASRARRRVRGSSIPDADLGRNGHLVSAFREASRRGNVAALLTLLDPDAVLRADRTALRAGAPRGEARGAAAVAEIFATRPFDARLALVNGCPGLVWVSGGRAWVVFTFAIRRGRIAAIDVAAQQEHIRQMRLAL
ncbi:MAG: sigma-70 family RNA polymerase sigma factor [Actinobacteria bacterium]|nr:sigma-70 family RNA polymerase sigma factor [Actinomycetota bacterium]